MGRNGLKVKNMGPLAKTSNVLGHIPTVLVQPPNGQFNFVRSWSFSILWGHAQDVVLMPSICRANVAIRRVRGRDIAEGSRLSHKADRYGILEDIEIVTWENDMNLRSHSMVKDDITYSFDASPGSQRGSHILSMALDQAMANFRGKQTDKLIKEEYEVVQRESIFLTCQLSLVRPRLWTHSSTIRAFLDFTKFVGKFGV